jgi:hypothetical protein
MNKVTGVSCPLFGISWNPEETQRTIARKIIIFLEPRRVLYAPYGIESLCQCIESVSKIKDYLTSELQHLDESTELSTYVRAMRKACNRFLSMFPGEKYEKCQYCHFGSEENWTFISSIGELRGLFGIMIGQVAKAYGIDVEDDLAQIIPD